MGAYALKRAILRDNEYYATIVFSRAVRWAVQLAFMLERQYYPYDKWTHTFFQRLPRLYEPLGPLVAESVRLSTPWERKLELLNRMADVLDHFMVVDGILQPHPKFAESPTSGYRLLEHAYAEILHKLPPELRGMTPVWEQIYWEQNHSLFVASLDLPTWDGMLNLHPEEDAEVGENVPGSAQRDRGRRSESAPCQGRGEPLSSEDYAGKTDAHLSQMGRSGEIGCRKLGDGEKTCEF